MKNTIHILLIALALTVTLSACTGQPTEKEGDNKTSSTSLFSRNDSHPLSKIIPDPLALFPDAEFITMVPDNGTSYQFCLNNSDVSTFNQYVQAIKEAGFTSRIAMISNQIYQAYTEDGLFRTMITYYESTDKTVSYVYVAVWNVEQENIENETP